jgi:hypothetical protein
MEVINQQFNFAFPSSVFLYKSLPSWFKGRESNYTNEFHAQSKA